MTAPEKKSEYVVDKSWKQFICQASHCEYNDRRSHCLHEWMELDDHGICIFFERRKDNLANKSLNSDARRRGLAKRWEELWDTKS